MCLEAKTKAQNWGRGVDRGKPKLMLMLGNTNGRKEDTECYERVFLFAVEHRRCQGLYY